MPFCKKMRGDYFGCFFIKQHILAASGVTLVPPPPHTQEALAGPFVSHAKHMLLLCCAL